MPLEQTLKSGCMAGFFAFSNSGDLSIENVLSQELKNRGSINPLFFYFHILQLRQLYSNLICFKKLLMIMLSVDKRNPD